MAVLTVFLEPSGATPSRIMPPPSDKGLRMGLPRSFRPVDHLYRPDLFPVAISLECTSPPCCISINTLRSKFLYLKELVIPAFQSGVIFPMTLFEVEVRS